MNDSPIHEPRQLVSRLALLVAVTAFVLSGCNAGTSEREELQLAGPASPPLTAEQWQPYAGFEVTARGGESPYTYSLNENWPAGISVGAEDGAVGGTPFEPGTFSGLVVLVEDGRGDTVSFELADELVVAPGSEAFRLITDVGWWETQPPTDLSEYSQMRLRFTFENTADFDMTFLGDEEPDGLEAELQVWTRPDLYETPTVHFDANPKGTFAPGESFSWELTVELNELTTPQTSIAIRPAQKERGSGLPAYRGWLTLVASELTLTK